MFPEEFIDYLVEYHGSRDYFECHEILEEFWKETDPGNKDSHWVGFILLAVSAYHHRRQNMAGAEKTMRKSLEILEQTDETLISGLGINYQSLILTLRESLGNIKKGQAYASIQLPIEDPALLSACKEKCRQKQYSWNSNAPISDDIIHRHTRRDRSEVINERNRQMELRSRRKR